MNETMNQINTWLSELGAESGATLTLDEHGCCPLVDADETEMEVHAVPTSDCFFLNAKILALPHTNREQVFYQALTLNLFQQETRGASVAIDPNDESLMLCFSKAVSETDATMFQNIVSNLFQTASHMRRELKVEEVSDPSPSAGDAPWENHQLVNFMNFA
ncbi:CesT family type III secretion system chaperone [Sulfidibacter corallicola]|uniref:CesT family type III secretion system chaperone n=1 Tax=Sulfidibacter corallicola TaxID=2818388 RepID=A0A8A4TF01_SULCO|nr:CesT family type III secretion system chaperone [Sulfidibacter corallicola]QTD48679.1 CesT family type III secretion system chaperone [Sulfidibacter corallicola]